MPNNRRNKTGSPRRAHVGKSHDEITAYSRSVKDSPAVPPTPEQDEEVQPELNLTIPAGCTLESIPSYRGRSRLTPPETPAGVSEKKSLRNVVSWALGILSALAIPAGGFFWLGKLDTRVENLTAISRDHKDGIDAVSREKTQLQLRTEKLEMRLDNIMNNSHLSETAQITGMKAELDEAKQELQADWTDSQHRIKLIEDRIASTERKLTLVEKVASQTVRK